MTRKRVGFLGYEGVMALDLAGPIDAFTSASTERLDGQSENCYDIVIIGLSAKPFTAESGIVFKPHTTISRAPELDTLIVPGGKRLRVPDTQTKAAEWIRSHAGSARGQTHS